MAVEINDGSVKGSNTPVGYDDLWYQRRRGSTEIGNIEGARQSSDDCLSDWDGYMSSDEGDRTSDYESVQDVDDMEQTLLPSLEEVRRVRDAVVNNMSYIGSISQGLAFGGGVDAATLAILLEGLRDSQRSLTHPENSGSSNGVEGRTSQKEKLTDIPKEGGVDGMVMR